MVLLTWPLFGGVGGTFSDGDELRGIVDCSFAIFLTDG